MKSVVTVVLAVIVLACGCRRKDSSTLVPSPGGRAAWSTDDVTAAEGATITVTLTLSRAPQDEPENVSLESSDESVATVPTTVTFPVGSTSRSVLITTIADDTDVVKETVITASTNAGSSELLVHVVEDDVATGPAHGPVTFGTGTVLLLGAGVDGFFSTNDEELVVATGVGVATPVLFKVKIGLLAAIDESLPVVTGTGDAVLVLGTEAGIAKVFQVQSTTSAPAVTASMTLPGSVVSAQRPVMVGGRAVIATLGVDGFPSADDGVFIVEGIGTSTLTMKTVVLPGLAAGAPSTPVPFDATSFLITSAGADMLFGTGDEALGIVSAIDTAAPVVTPLFTGRITGNALGLGIAAGPTTAAVLHAGADALLNTADDELQVIRNVPAGPVTPAPPFVVGAVTTDAAAVALATGGDSALVPLLGADLLAGTDDDTVALVTSLSVDPIASTPLAAARPPAGDAGALVRVSASAAARVTSGADGALGTSDDGVVLFTSLDTAPAATTVATGALAASRPFPSSSTSLALLGEGPDATPGTADDRTLGITGIGSVNAVADRTVGAFTFLGSPVLVPTAAGNAIAARNAGPDATASNADDRLGVAAVP
ncbi:MAG: hypothetical protein HYY18_09625 [Planctomycetes bacterium]|nr:hypothetical protein [Planctomycetota bacterium]